MNAEVLCGLMKRTFDQLQKCGRRWLDELPVVPWSLRTTPNRATGQTPVSLVYGACLWETTPMGSLESLLRLWGEGIVRRVGLADDT